MGQDWSQRRQERAKSAPVTTKLLAITGRKVFRDRSRPRPQEHAGSLAGIGGASPTGDPANEPFRLNFGRGAKRIAEPGSADANTPNVYRR